MSIIQYLESRNSSQLFSIALVVATVVTTSTYGIGHAWGWTDLRNPNWYEILAIWTSYASVFLCNFQSRWNYPIGIAGVGFYSLFYWTAVNPVTGQPEPASALAVFNLYLVGSLLFGYFRWGPDGNSRPVTYVEGRWLHAELPYLAATAVVLGALYVAVQYGAMISNIEITLVAGSALAQFLMDNKKIQSWIVWILVDIVSIYFYYTMGWYLVAFQYVFFLANAFWGLHVWYQAYKSNTTATQQVAI